LKRKDDAMKKSEMESAKYVRGVRCPLWEGFVIRSEKVNTVVMDGE